MAEVQLSQNERLDSSLTTQPQVPSPVTTPQRLRAAGWSRVASRVTAPPVSPVTNAMYLVIDPATDDFELHENDLARWTGTAWDFETPPSAGGWHCWIVDEFAAYQFDGTAWSDVTALLLAGGTLTGALRQTPATFAYAATLNISAAANNNHQQTDTVTGSMAITLTDGVDGDEGTISTVQDGIGSHSVTFAAAGRTVRYSGLGTVGQSPGVLTITGYKFATIGGIAYLLITNAATTA